SRQACPWWVRTWTVSSPVPKTASAWAWLLQGAASVTAAARPRTRPPPTRAVALGLPLRVLVESIANVFRLLNLYLSAVTSLAVGTFRVLGVICAVRA